MPELHANDPAVRVSPLAFSRQSPAWAAVVAFSGVAVGIAGIFFLALSWDTPQRVPYWALWTGPSGGLLAELSLLGVVPLLGRGSWAARTGVAVLILWLAASLNLVFYFPLWEPDPSGVPPLPPAYLVLGAASSWGGALAALPFALGSLFGARKNRRLRLGAVLLALSVPGVALLSLFNPRG